MLKFLLKFEFYKTLMKIIFDNFVVNFNSYFLNFSENKKTCEEKNYISKNSLISLKILKYRLLYLNIF